MTTNSSPPSRATHVARTQRAAQPAGDFHQQHVAGVMPERIVDDLEAVEIDEQHGELALVALGSVDRAAQHAVEHFAVRQIGQAVVRREIFDPFVGPGLFVGAIEILQRERHVVDEPLQQLGKLGRERVLLDRNEYHDADNALPHDQRERRAGIGAIVARPGVERHPAPVCKVIIDDAGPPASGMPCRRPRDLPDASPGSKFSPRARWLQSAPRLRRSRGNRCRVSPARSRSR